MAEIVVGDCLDVLRAMPDASVDAVVTDPPAGIAFMGKAWDRDKGGRDEWVAWLADVLRECLRVAKPGAHAFVWALPRTSGWTHRALEDAGWEVRDCVTHLFGSGFPKSHNLPGGLGTALKPAAEFWYLSRKPLQGTVAANVSAHGTGALNIDGCRIGTGGDKGVWPITGRADARTAMAGPMRAAETDNARGRWPANVALSCCGHDPHDPDCAAALLDAQAGTVNTGVRKRHHANGTPTGNGVTHGAMAGIATDRGYGDSGGPSRFFLNVRPGPLDDPDALRFMYCPKSSRSERNAGLDGMPERESPKQGGAPIGRASSIAKRGGNVAMANTHPTVKPVSLMRWLVRLVTPPGGLVCDPFAGSGTTGVACALEGVAFVGIEAEQEYAAIAERRIAHAAQSSGTHAERRDEASRLSG